MFNFSDKNPNVIKNILQKILKKSHINNSN